MSYRKFGFLLLFICLSGCSQPQSTQTASVLKMNSANISCTQIASELSTKEQVGQLLMLGIQDGELTDTITNMITDLHIGSVIFIGKMKESKQELAQKTRDIKALSPKIPLLVAVDQEGGYIQRLKGTGFSIIPSALQQGKIEIDQLKKNREKRGKELKNAGVEYNLGPVGDWVPKEMEEINKPIAYRERNFSFKVDEISEKAIAMITGLKDAGILSSVKHFPGIGMVVENTDFASAVDTVTTENSESVKIFENIIESGADSVMISNGIYTKIDPEIPATFSKKIIGELLRKNIGYTGVVISDDIGAAGAVQDTPPSDRGVKFLTAGGDIIINTDAKIMEDIYNGIIEQIKNDNKFRHSITQSVARILRMKSQVTKLNCK